MIEDKLVFRQGDFLALRDSRRNPQQTSGIITAVKHRGVIYSFGVFPTSAESSFVNAIENADCYEILADFNSIIIPYLNKRDSSYQPFAEILEIQQITAGLINEFCFVQEQNTGVYTPSNIDGITSLKQIAYEVVNERHIDLRLAEFLREQKHSLNTYLSGLNNLSSFNSTVECH